MALVKCRECGKDISSDAKACPNCGAKPINKVAAGCGGIAGLFILVVFAVSFFDADEKPAVSDGEAASIMCADFIKKSLRDPDSAEFITEPISTPALRNPEGSYSVLLTVRAVNGFGGKNVETFNCTTTKDSNGVWQLQNLVDLGG
jgi:hypothetical protein